jgi:hypothetical protein
MWILKLCDFSKLFLFAFKHLDTFGHTMFQGPFVVQDEHVSLRSWCVSGLSVLISRWGHFRLSWETVRIIL